MFDAITRISLLYDFYGNLLTKRQRDVIELYHDENLSLSEIAEEFEISRQGVHDALKNGEKALEQYEAKLGLVSKFEKTRAVVSQVDDEIDRLINEEDIDDKFKNKLTHIKSIIDKMNE